MEQCIKWYPVVEKTESGDLWGYIDQKGDYTIPPYFQEANDFQHNGLAVVKKEGLYGVIDDNGRYIVEPNYESISSFSEGRAQVIDQDGFQVIDERGIALTKKAYSYIGSYHNQRAVFADTNHEGQYLYGFLDEKANYDDIHMLGSNRIAVGKALDQERPFFNSIYAIATTDGRFLTDYRYFGCRFIKIVNQWVLLSEHPSFLLF